MNKKKLALMKSLGQLWAEFLFALMVLSTLSTWGWLLFREPVFLYSLMAESFAMFLLNTVWFLFVGYSFVHEVVRLVFNGKNV